MPNDKKTRLFQTVHIMVKTKMRLIRQLEAMHQWLFFNLYRLIHTETCAITEPYLQHKPMF